MRTTNPGQSVRIWDLPTRIFHWTLVAGIVFMWYSADISDSLMDWHARVGEFLLALVLFRIIWGLSGSETARFSSFLKPTQTLTYAKTLLARQPSWHAGHNPLGGWMVLALLLVILGQAVTGLFSTDDIFTEGPLNALVSSDTADELTSLHHLLFDVLLALIVLHVAAIIFYAFFKRTNLIKAMVHGKASWPAEQSQPDPIQFRSPWLALVIFLLCYAVVYFSLRSLSGY